MHRSLSMPSLVAALLAAGLAARPALAAPALDLPPGPVGASYQHPGPQSFFEITLAGFGGGFAVVAGVPYVGWCAEDNGQDNSTPVTLYDSYDPALPGTLGTIAWDRINYVLNHKQGTPNEVQAAIWMLTLGVSSLPVTPTAQAMIDDAVANGPGFVPAEGQTIAVILATGDAGIGRDGFQDTIIELVVPPACDCAQAFVAERYMKLNNDALVDGDAIVNQAGGVLRTGRHVVATDGSLFTADHMLLGNDTSLFSIRTNDVKAASGAEVRDGSLASPPPAGPFPIVAPPCTVPEFVCGGPDVTVAPGQTVGPLAPGSHGRVRVMNGGRLELAAGGTFTFCDVKVGRGATLVTTDRTTIGVVGSVLVGAGSYLGPEPTGEPIPMLYVRGPRVAVSQSGVLRAKVAAPRTGLSLQRDGAVQGCFCTDTASTDKHVTFACVP